MSGQLTLRKEERLKSRKQIVQLFTEGKKITVSPFRISYFISSSASTGLQFGIGVSNKNFKKAADRNRIKRLVKEAWRLQKNELKGKTKVCNKQLAVFFIFTGKEIPDYLFVTEKVNEAINRLIKLV